jgi:hypothetical protein
MQRRCFLYAVIYLLSSVNDDKVKQNDALLQIIKVSGKSTITIVLNGNGGYAGMFHKIVKQISATTKY